MGVSQGPQGCQASRKSPPWSLVFRDPTGSASFYTSASFPAQRVGFLCLFFYLQQLTSQVYASLFPSTHFTHRSNDSAFQLQISGSKSHYNPIRYSVRADGLKESEGPGPALCMPGRSQSKSIQGEMVQSQLISQKIRSLRYE